MATKVRLHWFWRGAIAVAAGTTVMVLISISPISVRVSNQICDALWWLSIPGVRREVIGIAVVLGLPSLVSAVTIYGALVRYAGRALDGELHCRRCHHILRGLSEPRCPECGEAIWPVAPGDGH